jgi:hypothetical protein
MASGDENVEILTREKTIEAFKVKLRIQIDQMDIMLAE